MMEAKDLRLQTSAILIFDHLAIPAESREA